MWVSLQYHNKIFKNMKGKKNGKEETNPFLFCAKTNNIMASSGTKRRCMSNYDNVVNYNFFSAPPNEQLLKVIRYREQNTKQNYWQ
jgi:hypothetical protein